MRVVDQHLEWLADVDALHATGHDHRRGETCNHRVARDSGGARGGGGRERVAHVVHTRQRQRHDRVGVRTNVVQTQRSAACLRHDVAGAQIRARRRDAERPHVEATLARHGGESPTVLVVEVDRGSRRPDRIEQRRLRREVRLERPVEVEVFVAHVGEARRRKGDAVDPTLRERVGRDFDGDRGDAAIAHVGEQRLEVARLGRGEPGRQGRAPHPCPDRADHAGLLAERAGDRLEEIGDRRLAVRAGDSQASQRPGRVAVQASSQRAEHGADVADLGLGHTQRERSLDQQCDGPLGHGGGGVVVPVHSGAGDAREADPGAGPAAVVDDVEHLDEAVLHGPVAAGLLRSDPGDQVVPLHACDALPALPRAAPARFRVPARPAPAGPVRART